MLSCSEATQLLSQRQDRVLKLNEKTQLTLHLSLCTHCRRFSKQMRQLSSIAKQYRDQDRPLPNESES